MDPGPRVVRKPVVVPSHVPRNQDRPRRFRSFRSRVRPLGAEVGERELGVGRHPSVRSGLGTRARVEGAPAERAHGVRAVAVASSSVG